MIKLKLNLVIALLALSFGLTGCGFQPLHGSTVGGQLMSNELSSVYVNRINSRVGQQVRNELLYRLTGGDYPDGKKYTLNVVIKESIQGVAIQRTGDASSKIFRVDAIFTLTRADKKNTKLLKSKSTARAAFDTIFNKTIRRPGSTVKLSSTYANIRAERDAGNRAAKIIANDIKTRVAAYLSSHS